MRKAALVPSWEHEVNNAWFFNDGGCDERQPRYWVKKYFEDNGVSMNTSDLVNIKECDGFIITNIGVKDILVLLQLLWHRKLHQTIYFPVEPAVTTPIHETRKLMKIAKIFGKVLTWNNDLVDNVKFFYLHLPIITQSFTYGKPFAQKKLVAMIVGKNYSADPNELYSKRIEAVRYFEDKYPDQFEFYGKRWQRDEFKSYKGMIEKKYDVYKDFKFAICYENSQNLNGYITEKIFDCFYSGIVPVYWGAENIEKYVPSECFIDKRKFASYDELASILVNMTEAEYNGRLAAIKSFLTSDRYQQFLPMSFAKGFYDNMIDMRAVKFSYPEAAFNLLCLIKWIRFSGGIGVFLPIRLKIFLKEIKDKISGNTQKLWLMRG